MNKFARLAVVFMCAMLLAARTMAQENVRVDENKLVTVGIAATAEYTDNRDGTKNNKEDTINLIATPSLELRAKPQRWILDLVYAPALLWRSNPREVVDGNPQNDTDIYHNLNGMVEFDIDTRSMVRVGDRFLTTDDPDVQSGGSTVRENLSYSYNQIYAESELFVSRVLGFGLMGRNTIKRYTDDAVADISDEDTTDAALSLMADVGKQLIIIGKGTFSDFENASTNSAFERGAQTMSYTLGLKKVFTPQAYGMIESGFQTAEYDNSLLDTDDSVYANLQLVYREQDYKFSGTAGYGIYQPYVRPYSSQKRAFVGVDGERTIAEKLTFGAGLQYSNGKYDEVSAGNPAGDDNLFAARARGTYKINRHLAFELAYQFENWDSDLRESFNRNTVSATIKAEL